MTRYLLDSNALNRFIFRRDGVHERAIVARTAGAIIGTGLPVAAEMLAGTESSTSRDRNLPIVLRHLKRLRMWPLDFAAAQEYARLYARLRKSGRRIQTIDLMIAAIAMTLPDCTVITSDSDLSFVPGLAVDNWAT